jgi:hypothetical protein
MLPTQALEIACHLLVALYFPFKLTLLTVLTCCFLFNYTITFVSYHYDYGKILNGCNVVEWYKINAFGIWVCGDIQPPGAIS